MSLPRARQGYRRQQTDAGTAQPVQRLRITFSRGDEAKYCSHLDLMRLWERALRRAGLPVAYSEGFTPHPRIAIASPLPVGVRGRAELMEIYLRKRVSPRFFLDQIEPQLPTGMGISQIEEAAIGLPSLQAAVRRAEYRVEANWGSDRADLELRVLSLMALGQLIIERSRPGGNKSVDLRALLDRVWVDAVESGRCVIGMLLRTDSQGSGRPEEVTAALGLGEPISMERVRLIFEDSPAT